MRFVQNSGAVLIVALLSHGLPVQAQAPSVCSSFTDSSLDSGTPVRALHVSELRACIDALRVLGGLPEVSWTDPILILEASTIRAVHLTEMRAALEQAYSAAGINVPVYTDASLDAGMTIKRAHVTELRIAAQGLSYPPTAAPTFSPLQGTYGAEQSVAMSTTTPNATIRYTIDGTAPNAQSPIYSGPIAVQASTTIRATAFRIGHIPGSSLSTYTLQVVAPSFGLAAGSYAGTQTFSLSTTTSSAVVRFTTDGTEPTEQSSQSTGMLQINPPTSIAYRARAFRNGWSPSEVSTAAYSVYYATTTSPTSSPAAGTFDIGQSVQLSSSESGAAIYYTLDGTEPTQSSTLYAGAFALNEPRTVRFRAYRTGYLASAVQQTQYDLRLPTPSVSPDGGTYASLPSVSVTAGSGPAVELRYTLNRDEPTPTSQLYSGPINVGHDETLTVAAFNGGAGWVRSQNAVATYFHQGTLLSPPQGSTGTLSLSPYGDGPLFSAGGTVRVQLNGATLGPTSTVWFTRNEAAISPSIANLSSQSFDLVGVLVEGRNYLTLEVLDSAGRMATSEATIFAGSRTLQVWVSDSAGNGLSGATVRVSYDDGGPDAVATTSNGTAYLSGVTAGASPTLSIEKLGYVSREVNIGSQQTYAAVSLSVTNYDLSAGYSGWIQSIPGNSYVVNHVEQQRGWYCNVGCDPNGNSTQALGDLEPSGMQDVGTATADKDFLLYTLYTTNPVRATRQLVVPQGMQSVSIRYRFTALTRNSLHLYADWYSILLGSVTRPAVQTYAYGDAYYDTVNGYTNWATLTLNGLQAGETIELDAATASVGDIYGPSYLEVDWTAADELRLTEASLIDKFIRHSAKFDLGLFSVSNHSYGTGVTQIYGTLAFRGSNGQKLSRVTAVVSDGTGTPKVTAELSSEAAAVLINVPISAAAGETGELRLNANKNIPLFSFNPQTLHSNFNQTTEERLSINIVAYDAQNRVVGSGLKPRSVQKLIDASRDGLARYDTERDSPNCTGLNPNDEVDWKRPDAFCGGDGWARPRTSDIIRTSPGLSWGDFSNLNGGLFPYHDGHRDGRTGDGYFAGYQHRRGPQAITMVQHAVTLEAAARARGWRIGRILVTYSAGDDFHDALQPLNIDGCPADTIIRRAAGHRTHFDIEFTVGVRPAIGVAGRCPEPQ